MKSEYRIISRHFAVVTVVLVMISALSGCDEVRTPNMNNAEPLAQKLLNAREHQDWNTALSLYGHAFYRNIGRDSWLTYLKHVQKVLGPLKSYTLESKAADTRFSGDFYILQYHTVYAHGEAHEIITIREPSDKDQFHIIGDHITAKGL